MPPRSDNIVSKNDEMNFFIQLSISSINTLEALESDKQDEVTNPFLFCLAQL
jgi:hypothetical protein